ncbi:hypothetical protein RchiOBHm_Chr2g0153511 [Rosa chinensis]|uniref:Uncharacterized protein n=1 Tax=Rosa chinensis TaxID=74649 RepID=A0A2P6S0P7_ROSCH|nr:hypothetical protein RchiOBHm_Chr2g0153511 [Rosa chinensis]
MTQTIPLGRYPDPTRNSWSLCYSWFRKLFNGKWSVSLWLVGHFLEFYHLLNISIKDVVPFKESGIPANKHLLFFRLIEIIS